MSNADTIEIYHVAGGKRPGWRFRMLKANGLDELGRAMLVSNGSYATAELAREVAETFNRQAFAGAWRIRMARA